MNYGKRQRQVRTAEATELKACKQAWQCCLATQEVQTPLGETRGLSL